MDPNTSPQTPPVSPTPQTPPAAEKPEEWKLIVTILTLFFFTPLGIIFMWLWMKNWPKWLKILITLIPIIFLILWFILFAAIFVAVFQNVSKPTPVPTAIISTPAPASDSAKIATSSATIDPSDPNLMDYDSPCMSFKFPNSWVVMSQVVNNKHIVTGNYDTYGYTNIILARKSDAFLLMAICSPNTNNIDLAKLQTLAKTGSILNLSTTPIRPDSVLDATVSGVPAVKLVRNAQKNSDGSSRGGVTEIGAIKNQTTFDMMLQWDNPLQNSPSLQGQKEFNGILNSVQIKDFFKPQ